ncbi:MAG: VOC family protein [Acidobacteriota bacterium]
MDWAEVILRVHDVPRCATFYEEALGMRRVETQRQSVVLDFPTRQSGEARLRLVPAESTQPTVATSEDAFWKLGITLPDLDATVDDLRGRGVEVTDPVQFRDIGYLCHLRDPSGHALELLQRTFRDTPKLGTGAADSKTVLAHVTLRIRHLERALRFWQGQGLQVVSRQPVEDFGFVLYFLAAKAEPRPSEDLEAVENREWLWQRPYTCLELQHWPQRDADFTVARAQEPGLEAMRFSGTANASTDIRLRRGDGFLSSEFPEPCRHDS